MPAPPPRTHTPHGGVAWRTAQVFERTSSSYHFPLALRHFDVVLCKYQSNNNGSEKGTEMRRLTGSQNVTFSAPPGLCPSPSPAATGGPGAGGQRGSTTRPWPHAGAATSLHVGAICASLARPALRGHCLELCLNNNSARERRELQSARRTHFFLFFFFLFSRFQPVQCLLWEPFERESTVLACERSRSSGPLYLESQDVIPRLEIFIVPCTPPTHTRTHACVWKMFFGLSEGCWLRGIRGRRRGATAAQSRARSLRPP